MKRKSFVGKGICLGLILVGMNACFYHIFFPYINILKFSIALMFAGMYFTVLTICPFQSLEARVRKKLEIKKIKNPIALLLLISTGVLSAMYVLHNILRYQSDANFLWDAIQRRYDIYYRYKVNWLSAARYDSDGTALLFTIEFFLAFFMAVAFYKLRSMSLGLMPLTIIVTLGLIWGKTPEVFDMVFLISGIVGMRILMENHHRGGRKYFRQLPGKGGRQKNLYPVIAILLAVVFLASSILSAKNQGVLEKEEELVSWQRGVGQKMEKKAVQLVKRLQRIAGTEQPGVLTNTYPIYDEVPVMTITVDHPPMGNTYLRGFTGINYEDGRWTNPARENTFSNDEYMEQWNEGYIGKEKYGSESSFGISIFYNQDISMNIEYAEDFNSKYAYIPYYSKISDDSIAQLQMNQDLDFTKDSSVKSYQITMRQNYEGTETELLRQLSVWNGEYVEEKVTILEQKGKAWLEKFYFSDGEELPYHTYVGEEYMQIPEEGLKQVERLVNRYVRENELVRSADSGSVLGMINSIKGVLNQRTHYSRDLEKKPADEDYLENFLMTQRKGFCEHYATAGTIIMRMLDVPSRYVSGYLVSPKQFKKNADGTYTAQVLDSDAHAWAEVYVPGLGWVEADMTPTGSGGGGNTLNSSQERPGTSVTEKPEKTKKPESFKSPEEEEELQEELEEEELEETPEPEEPTAETEEEETGGIAGISGKGKGGSANWNKVLVPAVCGVAMIAGLYLIWWNQRAHRRRRLYRCTTHREQILEMNRQMERFLRCCGIYGVSKKTDKEYIALLKYFCTESEKKEDMDQYYRLLEQSRFAKEDRSKADVAWCKKMLYDFGQAVLKEKGGLRRFYVRGIRNWRSF